MKYSLLLSLLSLIAWKYDCLFPAGLLGLLAGFLFSLLSAGNPDSCYRIYLRRYPDSHIISYRILFCRHSPYRYRLGGGHHSTYDVSYSL